MTRIALVTTTINVPVDLRTWAEQLGPDDVIVVAGDRKTPHADTRQLLANWLNRYGVPSLYLFDGPEQRRWRCARSIGWNTIQRRNLATLEALRHRPEVIITVDDDNFPETSTHVTDVHALLTTHGTSVPTVIESSTGWFNVGSQLHPPVTHRGFPRSHRGDRSLLVDTTEPRHLGVHASLWLGAPDVDAAERWHRDDPQTDVINPGVFQLAANTWCPFNSQATAYRGELGALLCVPPGLGRYDDIWGSYVARRVLDHLDYAVAYGAPYVRQERNPHDVITDLERELYGMRHTDAFVSWLRALPLHGTTVLECLTEVFESLDFETTYLPAQTTQFTNAWLEDLTRLEDLYVG